MSRPSSDKRPGGRTTGTNTLITAASLALTLSGWALLTVNEAEPTPSVAVPAPSATSVPLPALRPLPTLVPPPDWASIPSPVEGEGLPAAPAAVASAPPPRRVVPPPRAAVAPPAPPARPPQPVTVTRSSR